mgnify:FL=1
MPRNKKEGIIFGVTMCAIMAFFMGLLNISIHAGGLNMHSLQTAIIAFPVTFIIVFLLENLVVGNLKELFFKKVVSENESKNAMILFNAAFIVTIMSFIMTIIGGFLGGDNFNTIISEFFTRWPRNFLAAFFLNLLIAGPASRALLKAVQNHFDKKSLVTETADNNEIV